MMLGVPGVPLPSGDFCQLTMLQGGPLRKAIPHSWVGGRLYSVPGWLEGAPPAGPIDLLRLIW